MRFGVFYKRFAFITKTFRPYKEYDINRKKRDEQEMIKLKHIKGFDTAQFLN